MFTNILEKGKEEMLLAKLFRLLNRDLGELGDGFECFGAFPVSNDFALISAPFACQF